MNVRANIDLDSGDEKMTTDTIKSAVAPTIQTLKNIKEKYCPDGQTCNDIFTLGGIFFVVWFMYVAMKPIM